MPDRGAQKGQEKGKAQQGAQGKDAIPRKERGKGQQDAQREGKGKAQEGKDAPSQRGQREQPGQRDRAQGQREKEPRDQQRGERDQAGRPGDTATITPQQRTRIRQTVITRGPRVRDVDFSVSVGTAVPRTVRLVAVPTVLVKLYPQYRGRKYFVYNDQIVIVDDDFKIIAIITV